MTQGELFETSPLPVRKRQVSNSSSKPQWSKYNQRNAAKPHQCDFCVLNCHDDAMAPIPRKARYIRKTPGQTWYLCHHHANDQRVVDGLTIFRPATSPGRR